MTMQASLAPLRQSSNYASELSTEQKRTIRFFASAHMTAEEIASRLLLTDATPVRKYCKSVYINVK